MQNAFLDLITSPNKIMHLYTHQDWSNHTFMKIIYLFCRDLHAPRTLILLKIAGVFSSYRGETRPLEYASTGVVNSRYDYNNRHHE